jgi:16S rRNA G527 N7-methylase RsmG
MIEKLIAPSKGFCKKENHLYEIEILIKRAEEYLNKEVIDVANIRKKWSNKFSKNLIMFDVKRIDNFIIYNIHIYEDDYLKKEKATNRYLKLKSILD